MKVQVPLAVVLCAFLCACGGQTTTQSHQQAIAADPADPSPETYALGSTVTETGAVPKEAVAEAFQRGRDVYLSIDVTGASTDQAIEVKWLDTRGQVVKREVRDVPKQSAYAAFSSGRDVTSAPGVHRAVVVINGRVVTEKKFSVL